MKQNNKEKILEVSRRLFLQYGYNGISIRTIAARARLTTGAIYFHFKSKRDIYTTICIEAIEMLLKKFREGMRSREGIPRKLISTFDSFLSFYYENRDYYNILMEYKSEYVNGGEAKEEMIRKLKELIELVARTAHDGIRTGDYREIDPMMLALFLASVGEGMLQYKKLGLLAAMNVEDRDFRKFTNDIVGRGIKRE